MASVKSIRLGEPPFSTIQCEGTFTGVPSIFIRFFGCNLECAGFGQQDPTDPSSYQRMTFDPKTIMRREDIPIMPFGCDSAYSWYHKFKHLIAPYSLSELIDEIYNLTREKHSLDICECWVHHITGTYTQLVFTGGEPMLHQEKMFNIIQGLKDVYTVPRIVTIETNGTVNIEKPLECMKGLISHVHFSCSPKLWAVSGEKDRVDYDNLILYSRFADSFCLKFVHNGSEEAWKELDKHVRELEKSITFDMENRIFVMPQGTTAEEQGKNDLESITREAVKRGYNVTLRNQMYIFPGAIGT